MPVGAVIGTVVGILVAGVLAKLFPNLDLGFLHVAVVALGCFLGVLLDGTDFRRRRK
jgi:uncharacterized membrane protein AbrB (regulator of aidB expression)